MTSRAQSGAIKGGLAVVIALAFVAAVLAYIPAARIFLLISIPLGVVVALILYFVHKRRPVKLPEEANKRPLGLE